MPPIAQHEILEIHVSHDMVGYPSIRKTVYSSFSRVMTQVAGGDLVVTEQSVGPDQSNTAAGWSDGPWWRQNDVPATAIRRDLNSVVGITEAIKLAAASATSAANGMTTEAEAKSGEDPTAEENYSRTSNIFLVIQPVAFPEASQDDDSDDDEEEEEDGDESEGSDDDDDDESNNNLIGFVIYLYDPAHSISFHTLSQSFPKQWTDWLDHFPATTGADGADETNPSLPPDIAPIVARGGIDPREWVADWVEDALSLAVGTVAQRYVARRMGVGAVAEPADVAVAKKNEALESGAGEMARAI